MEVPPNQTIYINNLNEKVKKEGECKEIVKYRKNDTPFERTVCDKCRRSMMV